MKVSAVSYTSQTPDDAVDDYAVPIFDANNSSHDLPTCGDPALLSIVEAHKELFPGHIMVAEHFIPTTGNPVKIPFSRIPGN